jgi:uncharacterized protein (TIGR00369 family)
MVVSPLERFRRIAADRTSLAPVHSAFGTVVDHVEQGYIRAHVPSLPPPVLRGTGAVPVLADLVLSGAVSTTLPAGSYVTTLTMHVATLGPLPAAGARLCASGRWTGGDGDSAVGTAAIEDAEGRQIAVVTSRCATVQDGGVRSEFGRHPVPAPLAALEPRWDGSGVRLTAAPSLANAAGAVQGGVLAAVAAHALDVALGAANSRLAGAAGDLDVAFLRGVPADGAEFSVRAEVVRAGARFGSARAEVRDAAGRLAVVASAAQWCGRS